MSTWNEAINAALLKIPGGTHCDPQEVADEIRKLLKPKPIGAKTERGVMIMHEGKAWGLVYNDGKSTSYGWLRPEDAGLYDAASCKNPTDITYQGSPYFAMLSRAKLVYVERTTTVKIQS